jgi:hypothetical protein
MTKNAVLEPLPSAVQVPSAIPETKALFDSIAHDEESSVEQEGNSSVAAFFAGLSWFGYAVAIVVALVLVWSAANGLLKSLPR